MTAHSRYGHRCRPRDLHVRCPRCRERALACKDSEVGAGVLIGDRSPTWNLEDWRVTCESCLYRASEVEGDSLPDLYYVLSLGIGTFWAWNRDHLDMLHRLLDGESVAGDPYEWMATYAKRKWLLLKNRPRIVRAIERSYPTG